VSSEQQPQPVVAGVIEIARLLRFRADGRWLPLPYWAKFFIELGCGLAQTPFRDSPLFACVVGPTTAYAAPLSAVGAVTSAERTPSSEDRAEHFERLARLPVGTTVVYRQSPSTQLRGVLAGTVDLRGQRVLVMQLQSKKMDGLTYNATLNIPLREAHKIELASKSLDRVPARLRSTEFRARAPLMEPLLGAERCYRFLTSSELRCAVFGRQSVLKPQIVETEFGIEAQGIVTGPLQGILRARAYSENDGGGFLSDVYSYASLDEYEFGGEPPRVIVFDGSDAFLKALSVWPQSHRVAILGRSDIRLEEAAAEVNRMYAQRLARELPQIGSIPSPLEVVVF
jgi:hypothetical protein